MYSIFMISLILISVSSTIMFISSLLSKKSIIDREKSSPFECGFDPSSSSRMSFSLRFFLITIIFLIFDVEIALLLPIIMIYKISNLTTWIFTSILFIIILLMGLYHEWYQGMLSWTK